MYNVLYVEDNFDNYKLLEFILKKQGYNVYHAQDGIEAVEKAKEYLPDLIIMDMNLPNLKGYEVTSILKSNDALQNIPVIALTAAFSEEYEKLSYLSGCVGYFTKPIDPISFSNEVLSIIESPKQVTHKTDSLTKQVSKSLEDQSRKVMELNKKLTQHEVKFSKILSSLTDPIIITDKSFNIKFFNNTLLSNDIFQSYYNKHSNFHEIFELLTININDLESNLKSLNGAQNIELKLSNDDCSQFFLGNFSSFEDDILISLREITDKLELESKFTQMDKLATIGQITSGILHEINNPLTAIKTYLDILKMQSRNDKPAPLDTIGKIEHGFDRINCLARSLMNFAKPSQEKMYPINLNHIINEILNFSEYEIRRGDVNIELNLDKNIPLTKATKYEIEQVLLNLLINANHAVQGVNTPKITIATFFKDSKICLSISDNGCGIPDDIVDKVFEPFFSTKSEGKGTGLGLSMVQQILNRHAASIDMITSTNGTEFVIQMNVLLMEQ